MGELDQDDRLRCVELGERLRLALGALLAELPQWVSSSRDTAGYLGVNRNLAQRAIRSSKMDLRPEFVLVEAPGVRGIESILEKARGLKLNGAVIAGLTAACSSYQQLLSEFGGSQLSLGRKLKEEQSTSSIDDSYALREKRYELDREIFGTSQDIRFGVYVFRGTPGDANGLEQALANGRFGLREKKKGVALHGFISGDGNQVGTEHAVTSLRGDPVGGDFSGLIIEEFCSKPVPRFVSMGKGGLKMNEVESSGAEDPVDFFVGQRVLFPKGNPITQPPPRITQRVILRYPTKVLVFQIWLHKDLASMAHGFAGQYTKGVDERRNPRQRWYARVPGEPLFQEMGNGLRFAGSRHHEGIQGLVKHVFDEAVWDPNDFVGYQYQELFPIMGVDHLISFEFDATQEAPRSANHA